VKEQFDRDLDMARANLGAFSIQAAAASGTSAAAAYSAAAGAPGWVVAAVAIGAAALALSSFVVVGASALVILTTFIAAGTGAAILLSALTLGFGAIGAGVLLLGGGGGVGAAAALATTTAQLQSAQESLAEFDQAHKGHLTILQQQQREQLVENVANAQIKYKDALAASQGPTGVLIAQLTAMKDAWAAQAAPLAAMITLWAGGVIPAIQTMGSGLMTWFGDRLPGFLGNISYLLITIGPSFRQFGQFLGDMFDKTSGTFFGLASLAIPILLQALQGLITNLFNLEQWFINRLPSYGPIVVQVFSWMGSAIQFVAQIWGKLADWLVANWASIVAMAQATIKSIGDEWSRWAPFLVPLITIQLPALADAFKNISSHAGILVPLILSVALILVSIVTVVSTAVGWVTQFVTWLYNLQFAIRAVSQAGTPFGQFLGDLDIAIAGVEKLLGLISRIPGTKITGGPGGVATAGGSALNSILRLRGFAALA
jgi:hypothetical protein